MSNVVQLPKLIAWHPPVSADLLPEGWRCTAIALGSILCPSDVLLTGGDYLSFLADRIQRMVNLCEDPDEATEALRQDLFDAGLYLDECSVPADEASNRLIWSNDLGVGYRLSQWGLLPKGDGMTHEMPAAREQISADHYCTEDRLRSWAGFLSRLP